MTRRRARGLILLAAGLLGLSLVVLPALVVGLRRRAPEPAAAIRRESLVVVPPLPSPDPKEPGRWLRTDEITGDPELRAEVEWMASGRFVYDATVRVEKCGTSEAAYRANHPLQPGEESVLALRERIRAFLIHGSQAREVESQRADENTGGFAATKIGRMAPSLGSPERVIP